MSLIRLGAIALAAAAAMPAAEAKTEMQCVFEARDVTGEYDGLEFTQAKTACLLDAAPVARNDGAVIIDEESEPEVVFSASRQVCFWNMGARVTQSMGAETALTTAAKRSVSELAARLRGPSPDVAEKGDVIEHAQWQQHARRHKPEPGDRVAAPQARAIFARLAYDADEPQSCMAMATGNRATTSATWPRTEMPSQLRVKQKTIGTIQRPARIAHEARGVSGSAASNKSRIGMASRFNLTDKNHSHSERGLRYKRYADDWARKKI